MGDLEASMSIETDFTAGAEQSVVAAGLEFVRAHTGRADVEDAVLVQSVAETLALLGLERDAEELLAHPESDAATLRLVASCIVLPQPQVALAMPEHNLQGRLVPAWLRSAAGARSLFGARPPVGEG